MVTFRRGQIVVYKEFVYSPKIENSWSFEAKQEVISAHRARGAASYVKLGKINGGIYRSRASDKQITIDNILVGEYISPTSPSSAPGMQGLSGDLIAYDILPNNESTTVSVELRDIWNPNIDDILMLTSVKNLLETQYRGEKSGGGTNKNIKRHNNSRYKKSKRR